MEIRHLKLIQAIATTGNLTKIGFETLLISVSLKSPIKRIRRGGRYSIVCKGQEKNATYTSRRAITTNS